MEPIAEPLRGRVQAVIDKHGANAARRLMRVSEGTMWRAVAGWRIHRGSMLAIVDALGRLEAEAGHE